MATQFQIQDKLEALLALAREKHFGRAAQACGMSQPNLSLTIKQLEAHFGVPLVARGSRFVGFTPEGARLLEWARRIVSDSRAMHADIEAMKQGLTGQLRLAVVPTALPVVASLTAPFLQKHAGVRLTVMSRSSAGMLVDIGNLDIDAGITFIDNEPIGDVLEVPLYCERLCLVTSADGPLGDRSSVTWQEASSLPLCLLSRDMQNRRIVDRAFRSVDLVVEPALETNSLAVLLGHLKIGAWSAILPGLTSKHLGLPASMRIIPIDEPEVSVMMGLVVASRDPQPPLVAALIEDLRRIAPALDSRE